MVVLAGPINEVRAMITGWYRVPRDEGSRAMISRRHLLAGGAGLMLAGCDRLNDSPTFATACARPRG